MDISSLYRVTNIHIQFLILIIFIIIVLRFPNVFALSPSFSRQEVPDSTNDATGLVKIFDKTIPHSDSTACIAAEKYHLLPSPPDIQEVNYLSNGTTLNATIWLPSKFESPTVTSVLNKSLFAISIADISPNSKVDLSKYVAQRVVSLRKDFSDLTLRESAPIISTSNFKAYRISYIYNKISQPLYAVKIFSIMGNKLYTITYRSELTDYYFYLHIFQRILNSIQIKSNILFPNMKLVNNSISTTALPANYSYWDKMGLKMLYPSNWKSQLLKPDNNTFILIFQPGNDQFFTKDERFIGMVVDADSSYHLEGSPYKLVMY